MPITDTETDTRITSSSDEERIRQRILGYGTTYPVFTEHQLYVGRSGAAKEHAVIERLLADLEQDGTLSHARVTRGRGRPVKVYFLASFGPLVKRFWLDARGVVTSG